MRRPLVLSTALATALAAELAVGTLLVAPPALADETPAPAGGPTAPAGEPATRTGQADDAPSPPAPTAPADVPADVPEAPAPAVRSGRIGEVPAPDGADDHATEQEPEAPSNNAEPAAGGQPGRDTGTGTGTGTEQPGSPQPGNPPAGGPTRAPRTPSAPASGSPGTAPGAGPAPAPPVPAAPLAHTVTPGDNLWEIAAAHLAVASGRPRAELSALDIAPYWTRVCMANRPHLGSGDVNLIYPGEVIELPAF